MKTLIFIYIFLCSFSITTHCEEQLNDSKVERIESYVVKESNTLWDISKKLYGDATKWTLIYEANKDIPDSFLIYPGQVLIIPQTNIETSIAQKEISNKTKEPDGLDKDIDVKDNSSTSEELITKLEESFNEKSDKRVYKEADTALELLISSLTQNLSGTNVENQLFENQENLLLPAETQDDSLKFESIPVYSLVFVSDEDSPVRLKYFVGSKEVLFIDKDNLIPTDVKPKTLETCDKARLVANIIEDKGIILTQEQYETGTVYHIKRMLFFDNERYYNFILTNVNEHFIGFPNVKEPLDILRIRIFSNNGCIYLTDKGLQGFTGYFFGADAQGNQIKIDPNEPIIQEKYEKALDLLMDIYHKKSLQQYDPDAKEKLEKIF